ncbi:hypothetical protein D3C75_612150 [compost metagenome]
MGVVGYTFGDGPGFKLHTADKGFADLAAAAVPLDDKQGQEVIVNRWLNDTVYDRGGIDAGSGQILIRDHLNGTDPDTAVRSAGGELQILQLHRFPLDRLFDGFRVDVGRNVTGQFTVLG